MAGARPNGVTSGSQRLSNVYGVARQFHPRILRDYFERLNFFSPENHRKYGQLEAAVDRNAVSWVPLGSADNALYRLHPEFDGLLPHGKATRQSLPLEFLGVNTNVAPQTGSRRTADSAESDDVGNECFVAHQLGELTSWSRDKKRLRPSDEGEKYKNSDNWEKTGFFVVAQLSFSGIAERLYLIVDSFSQLEDGSRPPVDHDYWGRLPSEPHQKQFTCARLKGPPFLLSGRSFDTPFALEAVHEHLVELVHLKKATVGDRSIPETVHHKKE